MTVPTEAEVTARFAELAELDALGESLLGATVPSLQPAQLRARALVVSPPAPGREVPAGLASDRRDVVFALSPGAVARDVGWMGAAVVDPAYRRVAQVGPFLLAAAWDERSRQRVDRVAAGHPAIVVVRFLGARPSFPDVAYLCTGWDAARVDWTPEPARR